MKEIKVDKRVWMCHRCGVTTWQQAWGDGWVCMSCGQEVVEEKDDK